MDQHFCILRFFTQRAGEATMVFVGMGQDDAAQIRDEHSGSAQSGP
jgi:hypothetical protein